jgi:hypothetical protein
MLQPLLVAAGGDDARGAEEPRRLDCHRAGRSRGSEDDDAVVRANGRALRQRQPARDPGDAAGGGDAVVEPVWNGTGEFSREVGSLDEEAVLEGAPPVAEDVHALSVEASHRLAARDVGQRRVTAVEAARGDGEVERVESDRRHLERPLACDLGDPGRRAELGDLGSTHPRHRTPAASGHEARRADA